MAKSSLSEQLDQAVEAMLANSKAPDASAGLLSLTEIAADLRLLPRADFKVRLKSDLERKAMATATKVQTKERQSVAPRLRIKGAPAAIEFYKKAFGAKENMRFENVLGLAQAEIQIGNAVIMVAEEAPDYGFVGPEALGGSPVSLELFVDDSDAVFARAIAAGASEISSVKDEFYGYRSGRVADPFGYIWTIATVKEEMSVEEMHRRFEPMLREILKKPDVDPVPKGYRTVTPYVVAENGEGLIEFAKNVFEAEEVFRTIGGAGGIHCELRIGDSMVMMGGGRRGHEFRSKPAPIALHVYVKDTDATYERAIAAGATSLSAPADQEYGERGAGVRDAFGNYWYIATGFGEHYIPGGLHNVNAYLHPLRAPRMIEFLKRAFGAQTDAIYQSPDGIVHHARVKVGDTIIEMGEASGPYQPMLSMFYLYVKDCDELYARALRAGATSISEPQDQSYGDRSGGVRDPFGNQWYIATRIKEG